MASQVLSTSTRLDNTFPVGVRRSRFSLHFNTPRARRWLLVQLVSVPADKEKGPEGMTPGPLPLATERRESYNRVLDDFQTASFLARARGGI